MTLDHLFAIPFVGLALILLGLLLDVIYEVIALWSAKVPTLSRIMAWGYTVHPRWGRVLLIVLCVAFGALVTHFTHWTP